jgi:RNA recognition motif. (a.k.a. RRM, RBD, or RNP domain)
METPNGVFKFGAPSSSIEVDFMSNYSYQQGQQPPAPMPILHNPFRPDRPALPFRAAGDKDVAKQQSIYSGSNKDYLTLKNREKWSSGEITSHQLQQQQRQPNKKAQQQQQAVPVHGKIKPDRPAEKKLTVVRESGGQVWDDQTLLEWDPSHFRLFVGDLAGEVTDETLFKAFSKYPTLVKARVVRDKKTTKSKGFGFVSFSTPDDFLKSWKEMNGKYIGSHPIKLRKATTELKPKVVTQKSLEAKKRYSPYEVAKSAGEGKNWKEIKKKERRHNRLIGLH